MIEVRKASPAFKRIYLSYLRKAGTEPRRIGKEKFYKGLQSAIQKRIANIYYLRSGWNVAIRIIGRAIGKQDGERVKTKYQPRGGATPAREGWNPIATIESKAGLNPKFKTAASYLRVLQTHQAAVKAAIDENVEDMKKHIYESQKQIWNTQ